MEKENVSSSISAGAGLENPWITAVAPLIHCPCGALRREFKIHEHSKQGIPPGESQLSFLGDPRMEPRLPDGNPEPEDVQEKILHRKSGQALA